MPALATLRTPAPIASNDAAFTTTPEAVQLHLAAVNALAQALHTLRHGDMTPEVLSRAVGRAIRAATMTKRLATAVTEGGAA